MMMVKNYAMRNFFFFFNNKIKKEALNTRGHAVMLIVLYIYILTEREKKK